jgi:RNA polymerase sigma-70 factor (ECF subfamily)
MHAATDHRPDAVLIAGARLGDAGALDALIERHLPRVRRFSMKMCRAEEDADDVSQETFMTAAGSIGRFRGESSFGTWLYAIARSFCMKKRRLGRFAPGGYALEQLRAGDLHRLSAVLRTPEDDAVRDRTAAALDAALLQLEPMYREVLILRDLEGSAPEVAEALGLNVHTVKTGCTARGWRCALSLRPGSHSPREPDPLTTRLSRRVSGRFPASRRSAFRS